MLLKQIDDKGFTLIEIAIVMVIIGILAGGGVSLMGILSERKIRNESLDYLSEAKTSLINFANINGRLPWADSNGDGNEDVGTPVGTFPFLTLRLSPTDSQKRPLKYALNSSLGTDLSSTCSALRGGLSGAPLVVDADGSPTPFPVAVVLVSAGPKDADGDGNVFDDVTTGTHQGDNTDGNPNYIRYPPNNAFDDMLVYLGEYVLYGEICGSSNLSVSKGPGTGSNIFVYNWTQGSDIAIIIPNSTTSYGITSGSQIELRDTAGGGGSIVTSTPMTPLVVAGSGVTLVVP
ncbi:MAG TPA: type II secretion system protein [Desulfatiglandales bacterium]|nr:type II secretion system protein [Desulfatiglandales bacterium]